MSLLGWLLCRIGRHQVAPKKYKHDVLKIPGPPPRESCVLSWSGICFRCGREITKVILRDLNRMVLPSLTPAAEEPPHAEKTLPIPPIPATTASDLQKRSEDKSKSCQELDARLMEILPSLVLVRVLRACEQ